MATYDFICRDCDAAFEVFSTGFLKEDQKQCPSCGSTDVEQQFTGFMCGGMSSKSGDAPACPAGTRFG
jgi:putative FmdB family regulatory protein